MIPYLYFGIGTILILFMGMLDRRRSIQWFVFGILFCMISLTLLFYTYFEIWVSLLPTMIPAPRFPGGAG